MAGMVLAFVGGSYGPAVVVVVDDAALSGSPFMSTAFGG
jgi:hypothetical protein